MSEIPPVRAAQIVRAGSGQVWAALTSRQGLEGWFATRVLADLRDGGFLHFRWKDWGPEHYTGDARADLERVVARRRLTFRWQSHAAHPRTRVDVRLESRGPITLVRLEETGFGSNVAAAIANAAGWGEALVLLKFYVERARKPRRNARRQKT